MYHFCTYFNRPYIVRGLALYQSLKRHAGPFTLWVLCLDDFTFDVIRKLDQPDLKPISPRDFEEGDEQLLGAKKNRSMVEYFFTLSPAWPLYLFKKNPEMDIITYLDADLCLYANPAPVYAEMGDESFLMVRHRFPERMKNLEIYGVYNVGVFTVRNDSHGREMLQWWREQSIAWCHDRAEDGKFAHQKYLDDWLTRYGHVRESNLKGWNVAPWNWMNYRIEHGKKGWTVDGEPLICFHFHSLKFINHWLFDPVSHGRMYGEMPLSLRRPLYGEYMRALKAAERWAQSVEPGVALYSGETRGKSYGWKGMLFKALTMRLMVHSNSG